MSLLKKYEAGHPEDSSVLPPAAAAAKEDADKKRLLVQIASGELGSVDEIRKQLQEQVARGELTQAQADQTVQAYLNTPGTARARTE